MAHNLPVQLTSFIGREREIAQIKALLARTRLMTLTGAGGVGKTRLAFQVAAGSLDRFADGVWAVDLAPLADPALVPGTAASALDVTEQSGREVTDVLVAALRDRTLLLVLDNCEHVRPACAQLAGALLRGCPGVRILATSREPLNVAGETLWRVPSLSLPDPERVPPPERLEEYEAPRLFVERARARDPRFAVTAAGAGVVVQICRRLDGIPLAIELAASRTRVLGVEQIAARLDDRFALLTGGAGSSPPRQQTLRATMEWSYALLGSDEQTLLRRLATFSGGWTLGAAESVSVGAGVERGGILDLLTSLVDKSLVLMEVHDGEARYRLLETVRQYGRDKLLEAAETAGIRRRHGEWYLTFAEEADAQLYTPEQAASLRRLEAEHDNLRAALEWSEEEPDGAQAGLRLAGALGWFWYLHGHWAEGRAWLSRAISRADRTAPEFLPKALLGIGRIIWFQGDTEEARPHFERGLTACRDLGQTGLMPGFLYWLARLALGRRDFAQANVLLDEGLAICRARGDTWWACQLLAERGEAARAGGDDARAERFYREGLAISRATGATNNSILFLHNLGRVALHLDRVRDAADHYAECLALLRRVRHLPITASCFEGLARVEAARGDYVRAARLFGAATALETSLGRRQAIDQDDRERRVTTVRAALGEPAFRRAFDEGGAMTPDEAIECALESGTAAPKADAVPGGLTAREREVAGLVAEGMSNREIAARLVVTERTAETHVQNILNKLGFSSRAQIAAWAARNL